MPFCDIPQVNILTALLRAHGLRHVVCCPGSRNATIVHNLHQLEAEGMSLFAATDERSAAFVALGMTLAEAQPVAVCVTSGSALLACLPAVAEAYYRHLPLLVISADRPPQWIGQMDGQTLPQVGSLMPYCPTYQLTEVRTQEDHWFDNLQANRALLSLKAHGGGPAHINVPIAEPMFSFTTESLPEERIVRHFYAETDSPIPASLLEEIHGARLPALLIGQSEKGELRQAAFRLESEGKIFILPELIADVPGSQRMNVFDALNPADAADAALIPDLIVQIGGHFIHKRFKQMLRQREGLTVVRIGEEREWPDTFCQASVVVEASPLAALTQMARELPAQHEGVVAAQMAYSELLGAMREKAFKAAALPQSDGAIDPLSLFISLRSALAETAESFSLHLGNSSTIRWAQAIFESGSFPIFCNRGTNGIEGSLSTAVGYALCMWGLTIVVVGDLSFFYDANALWNLQLPAGLRILLLNNGRGGIFDGLPGLSASPALDRLIASGGQDYTAEGIARTFHLDYRRIARSEETAEAIGQWLQSGGRAKILEVALGRS